MADHACYWAQYREEFGEHGEPIVSWFTRREWFYNRIQAGDRLWLFIGGDACGEKASAHQGYLAEVFLVCDKEPYVSHDPQNPYSPRFEIIGDDDRCYLIQPPLLVDHILCRRDENQSTHIGVLRQTPTTLEPGIVQELLCALNAERPDVYARLL